MICPDCGAEYQDHVRMCADCHVILLTESEAARLEAQAPQPTPDAGDLVHLVSLKEMGQVVLAKSLLNEAKIPAMVRNEHLQNLFGLGQVNFNPISGVVEFYVLPDDLDRAREVLADLGQDIPS